MKLDANMSPVGSVEAKDDFAMAPPGYGLTFADYATGGTYG